MGSKKTKVVKKKKSRTPRSERKTAATAKKQASRKVAGYAVTEGGVLVPAVVATPVPGSKLRAGFKRARKEIDAVVEEMTDSLKGDFHISQIELSASFNADGKFLGFGVGGAATIKITITPE